MPRRPPHRPSLAARPWIRSNREEAASVSTAVSPVAPNDQRRGRAVQNLRPLRCLSRVCAAARRLLRLVSESARQALLVVLLHNRATGRMITVDGSRRLGDCDKIIQIPYDFTRLSVRPNWSCCRLPICLPIGSVAPGSLRTPADRMVARTMWVDRSVCRWHGSGRRTCAPCVLPPSTPGHIMHAMHRRPRLPASCRGPGAAFATRRSGVGIPLGPSKRSPT